MNEEIWEMLERLQRRQYYQGKRIKELEKRIKELEQPGDGDGAKRAFITIEECQPAAMVYLSRKEEA